MRKFLVAFYLAIVSASAASQSLTPLTYRQILDKPGLAATRPDHKIAYGEGPQRYGELWLPPGNTTGPLPVVVLIHGGCWLAALPGPELVAFLADELRKHGVAVWSLTYRRIGHAAGGYPGTFYDVADGVAHLREIAGKYNLDLSRVVAAGHSAGGHLALWVSAQERVPAGSVIKRKQLVNINAVVGIAAIPDLAQFASVGARSCGEDTVAQLVGTTGRVLSGAAARDDKALYRDTSPAEMLPLGVKQVLMQAAQDRIVPPAMGPAYQARAKQAGENIDVVTLEDAGHFELIAPWTAAGKAVVARILAELK